MVNRVNLEAGGVPEAIDVGVGTACPCCGQLLPEIGYVAQDRRRILDDLAGNRFLMAPGTDPHEALARMNAEGWVRDVTEWVRHSVARGREE